MEKFTPGPWEAHQEGPEALPSVLADMAGGNFFYVAQCNKMADAELIAAAPSMFQALCAIADMKISETAHHNVLLELCIKIAKIEVDGSMRRKFGAALRGLK